MRVLTFIITNSPSGLLYVHCAGQEFNGLRPISVQFVQFSCDSSGSCRATLYRGFYNPFDMANASCHMPCKCHGINSMGFEVELLGTVFTDVKRFDDAPGVSMISGTGFFVSEASCAGSHVYL